MNWRSAGSLLLVPLLLASSTYAQADPPAKTAADNGVATGAQSAFDASRRDFDATKREIAAAKKAVADAKPAAPTSGFLPLPVLFYGPETNLGFGAFGLYYFHVGDPKTTRSSNVRASVTGTTKGQVISELDADLWLAKNTFHFSPTFFATYFPDAYYGIGNATPDTARETYTERSYITVLNAQARVISGLYAGLRARLEHRDVLRREPGKELDSGAVYGGAGGFVAGGGPAITYDSRDNTYAAARGTYVDLAFASHPRAFGSEFMFGQVRADLRKFIPIGSHVLAFQLVGEAASGETPFYLLSRIGGGNYLRGVTRGRYRDNMMVEGQAEYRFPIFGRLGGVAFLGTGKVAHTLKAFDLSGLHTAGGTGLRFAIVPSERINIRLDFAYAATGIGYYLDLGEAF